jgi:Fe2+ transport system protein FeoA
MTTLDQLKNGQKATITDINGGRGLIKRLESLNLRKGKEVQKISSAPFRGPIVLEVDGCQLALGRGMAAKVIVEPL